MSERDTRSINTILVPERDTRSIYIILVPKRDTRSINTILVWERNTRSINTILVLERDTRSIYTILVPERDTRSPNLILLVHQAFFYTKASSLTKRFLKVQDSTASSCLFYHNYIITSCKHTIKHMEGFKILPNTYHSLLRVYYGIA